MKSLVAITLFFTVLILTNVSCKKDAANSIVPDPTDTTDTTHNNPVTGTPLLLKSMYYVDTTLSAPGDTLYKFTMSYDASNRLVLLTSLERDRATGDSTTYLSTEYAYNGNDTFANRIIRYKEYFQLPPTSTAIYHDTTYFIFSNGQHVSDSTLQSGYRREVHRYTHNSGMLLITGDTWYPYQQHSTQNWSNVFQTFSNNDIAYQLDTFTFHNLTGPTDNHYDRFEWTFNHLSNPNPMYKVALPVFNPYYHDEDYMYGGTYEPQHLLSSTTANSQSWNDSGTSQGWHTTQVNYNYEFRNDGYPTIGRATVSWADIGSPTTTTWYFKILYRYNQ